MIEGIARFHADKFIDQHKELTDKVHEHGAKIFLQAALVDSVFELDGDFSF